MLITCFAIHDLIVFDVQLTAPILHDLQAQELFRSGPHLPVFVHAYFIEVFDVLGNMEGHVFMLFFANCLDQLVLVGFGEGCAGVA